MTFNPARMLPDVDDVVRLILADTGVAVGANVPAKLVELLPYIAAKRIGGSSVDPANLDRATVSVDCYSGSRRTASEMAEACRTLLYRAWMSQKVYAGGSVAAFSEATAPFEIRTAGEPAGVYRFTATFSIHVRPSTRG